VFRVLACFFACVLAAESQDVTAICQKIAARYKSLDGYRIEGNFETYSGSGGGASSKFLIESDAKAQKLRVETPGLWVVSNGSSIWTYMPEQKKYSKVDAATDQASDQEEANSNDAALAMYRLVARAFASIDQRAAKTEMDREQDVKTADGKIRCWVMVSQFPDRTEKIWVDEERYLVLKSDVDLSKSHGETARVAFSIKRFDVRTPSDADFAFTPHSKDVLVDELDLPGQPAFVGRPAMDFELKDLDGQSARLSEMRGKVVVLDFWATWCGPCREELPTIDKLANRLKGQNVVFLGVNDEGASTVKSFNKKHNYSFTTLEDTHDKVHAAYRANAIPSVFVIAKDGTIVKHFVGGRSEEELLAAIHTAQGH